MYHLHIFKFGDTWVWKFNRGGTRFDKNSGIPLAQSMGAYLTEEELGNDLIAFMIALRDNAFNTIHHIPEGTLHT